MNRILSTNRHRKEVGNSIVLGNSVRVEINGQIIDSTFIQCAREYDKTEKNQLGEYGAIVNKTNAREINRKIIELKNKYPEIEIQENHK